MSICEEGGIPVTGSSLALSCARVHDGVILRSAEALEDVISKGISRAVFSAMVDTTTLPNQILRERRSDHQFEFQYLKYD